MKNLSLIPIICVTIWGLSACQTSQQANSGSTNNNNSSQSAATLPGKGVKVRSGYLPRPLTGFVAQVVDIGLEKLGYQVETKPFQAPALVHLAVAQGDIDILPSHLANNQQVLFNKNGGEQKLEKVGTVVPSIVQGYRIDKKTADSYKITSLAQLKDPKLAKLFDSDGDGKANLIGCSVGGPCEMVVDYQIKAYGLENTVEHDKVNIAALDAQVMSRYQQGKPVLYLDSVPGNPLNAKLKSDKDVVWLTVPSTALPKELSNFTEKDTTYEGKNLGFIVDRFTVLGNKKFLDANPVAKRWFEQVQIPDRDIVELQQVMLKEGDSPKDIRRHAENWINTNQAQFDRWLEESKKAAKS